MAVIVSKTANIIKFKNQRILYSKDNEKSIAFPLIFPDAFVQAKLPRESKLCNIWYDPEILILLKKIGLPLGLRQRSHSWWLFPLVSG